MIKRKITVGIVEDEEYGREYLSLLLANEFPDLKVAFMAAGMREGIKMMAEKTADILLLDVELGDGTSFDLLSKVSLHKETQIIFITAFDQYAIQAIKNNAADYILKPVNKDEFVSGLKKVLEKISSVQKDPEPVISLSDTNGFRIVPVRDIIRCRAESNYTIIFLSDKSRIVISKTLQTFEEQLAPYDFLRVHHKHLINLRHVKEFISGKERKIIMADGSETEVSVRKKNEFMLRMARKK